MKKFLLTLATVACFGTLSADAQWEKVMSTSELKAGVDYILVAPHLKWVMTTNDNNTDDAYRLGTPATFNDGKIEGTPSNTAIFTIEHCGNNYALKQTNAGQTGYLSPVKAGARSLTLSQTPVPLTLNFMTASQASSKVDDSGAASIFSEGDLVMECPTQATHNLFGMFKNPVDGVATFTFQFLEQNDQPVALFKKMGQTGTDLPLYTFSVNGGVVEEMSSMTYNIANVKSFDLSDDADDTMIKLTRNGVQATAPQFGRSNTLIWRPALTEAGEYVLTIEPGVFDITLNNGTKITNPQLTTTFRIPVKDAAYSFNLDNNAIVDNIDTFTLTFEGVKSIALNPDAVDTDFLVSRDGVKVDSPNYTLTNPMAFSYRTAMTTPGLYTFTWKAGLFNLTMEDGSVQPSTEMTLNLRIKSDRPVTFYETDPANGGEIKSFTSYTVTFPEANTVSLTSGAGATLTQEGNDDPLTGFTLKGISGNTATFIYNAEGQTTLADGKYTVSIDEGSFLLNGSTKSTAIISNFTVNSNLVQGATLKSYITTCMPVEYQPLYLANSDMGMNEIIYNTSSEANLSINKSCTSKITIKQNNILVGEIAATNSWRNETFAEVFNGGAGFSAGQQVKLTFNLSNPFEDGKYVVSIPAGFFQNGDELLQACTFYYSIGLGTFIPANGSTVDLKNPNTNESTAVFDGELRRIYLTTYYDTIVLNAHEESEGDPEYGRPAYNIPGVEASAVLYRVKGKEEVKVAEFPLGTPAAAMTQGRITLALNQNGNSPILTNGDYKLFFPYNYFRIQTAESNDGWSNFQWEGFTTEELESGNVGYNMTFSVTGGRDADAPEQTYTYSPEAGEYYPFPAVQITYTDGCNNIVVNEGAKATLYYNSAKTNVKGTFTITATGNVVTLTPDAPITDRQTTDYLPVILDIPADSYTLVYSGKEYSNYPIEITDIKVGENPENPRVPTITPDGEFESVDDIKVITLVFGEAFKGANTLSYPKLYRVDETRARTQVGQYKVAKNADNTTITLTLNEKHANTHIDQIVPGGQYELEVPSGIVYWMDGTTRANFPKTTYTLTMKSVVSGVDGIEADNTLYTVYTLTGIRVLNNADADALKALNPGLYIVNGKKVLVK
ncbi:MAG: hypothetical protein NC328_06775 [Muribaculum sp.]|nr:hypothetical protein [Muribaculum sp.]